MIVGSKNNFPALLFFPPIKIFPPFSKASSIWFFIFFIAFSEIKGPTSLFLKPLPTFSSLNFMISFLINLSKTYSQQIIY